MIEKRPFGRTGHMSSAVIFGAAALKHADQATVDRVLDLLLEHGVNHIDTAPRYGLAEERIGPWMSRHRDAFFLATKIGERDRKAGSASIHRSLDRLKTDRIDLIQLHALGHPDEWQQAFGEGGVLEACIEARQQGLVRFIGVTGHGWTIAAMHRRSLERFDFDSILLPWNWFCARNEVYARDFEAVIAEARRKGVAVQTIKALARGPWGAGAKRFAETWYEPITDPASISEAVGWVLGEQDFFLNSTGDIALLPALLEAAARRPARPGDETMRAMAQRQNLSSIFGVSA